MTLCDLTSIFGHYHFNVATTARVKLKDDRSLAKRGSSEQHCCYDSHGTDDWFPCSKVIPLVYD